MDNQHLIPTRFLAINAGIKRDSLNRLINIHLKKLLTFGDVQQIKIKVGKTHRVEKFLNPDQVMYLLMHTSGGERNRVFKFKFCNWYKKHTATGTTEAIKCLKTDDTLEDSVYTYFIRCATSGLLKVGQTKNLLKRILSHSVSLPSNKLEILNIVTEETVDEKYITSRYRKLKVPNKREWYYSSPSFLNFIKRLPTAEQHSNLVGTTL